MADQTVRAILTGDMALSGEFTTPDGVALAVGDKVLAQNQNDPLLNVIYDVASDAWTQSTGITYTPGMDVRILEGNTYGMSRWVLSSLGTITVGSTAMVWRLESRTPERIIDGGLQEVSRVVSLPENDTGAATEINAPTHSLEFSKYGILESTSSHQGTAAYIQGGYLIRTSASGITCTPVTAYVLGTGEIFDVPASLLSDSGGISSTFVYFYLDTQAQRIMTSSVPPILYDATTHGTSAYENAAGGINYYRRYLQAARTDASGNFYNFMVEQLSQSTLLVTYLEDVTTSPFRAVSGGTATTNQTVDLGPSGLKLVPSSCRMVYARVTVNTAASVWIDNSEMSTSPELASGETIVNLVERAANIWISLDANQSFRWANTAASGSTFIDIKKYIDRR